MKALQKLAARYPRKRVLITGATSGLGEVLALRFAGAGFRVAVASRNPTKVAATSPTWPLPPDCSPGPRWPPTMWLKRASYHSPRP